MPGEPLDYDYKSSSGIPLGSETHGGDDVGIWAIGELGHRILIILIAFLISYYVHAVHAIDGNYLKCNFPMILSVCQSFSLS